MLWLIVFVLVPVHTHLIDTPQNITSSSPCTDQNHLFLAPGVLSAGGSSRACVSRFHPEGPARMLLTLQTENGEVVTATRDLPPGDGGCLDIAVPQKPNTKANLNVNLRYPEANCVWSGQLQLRIASSKVVVVHTERARYRPGDTVRVRVLALKADLTPAHGNIDEIWIEGPRGIWDGVRAAQWLRVRTRLGLAQVQQPLDALAPPGKWLVTARLADGSQGSATFSVGNYELPPFQLTVRHAPRVLRTSERLVWTVCVRYPWSEAVEGMLVIRLRGLGSISEGSTGIRTAVRLKAPRACHRHAAASRRIGLDGHTAPDVVVADFSFQEEGTRIWQNTTVVSQVVDDPVTLEFLTKYRAVISPGLPYKLKVKATRWDDKPAANERVRVCRSPVTSGVTSHDSPVTSRDAVTSSNTCVDAVTDARGVARALFNAEDDASPFYRFEARLNNATASLQLASRAAASKAALGPLKADSAARSLVPLYLNLGNVSTALTVHFVVITRGGIIYRWGATTQCPTAVSSLHTAPRNTYCVVDRHLDLSAMDVRNASDVDALLERHLLRVVLPIKVSPQMCPHSRLLAFLRYNGELLSATKYFDMEECFGNKVETNWLTRQTPPGSMASLQLITPGPALCALSVLDTASKWVQPPENIRDVLMLALRRLIDAHRNLTEHDAAGECFLSTDMPELPTTSMELMMSWLAAGGVRVAGGDAVRRHCDPAPELLLADDAFTPRTDFSEAWLWRLISIGANGSAITTARAPDSITRFEASAYCLSRTGIGISQPAVLQVFREFFIHADGPRRLRRGDSSIIRYRIFNYLYESLNVQIQVLTDPHIESTSEAESACLGARSSVARRLEVRARFPGEARISIRAKSTGGNCANSTGSAGVTDEVIIKIQIEQEGIPVHEHKSIMLCARGTESAVSPNFVSWSWPRVHAVPGTESLTMWAVGDVTGPLLADADSLVTLPRGCGEQNMARLATNLLALRQLDRTSAVYFVAKDHVARGFTRQLQYAHSSGGFSAFGASDPQPSTWLTAFCVRYMRRAYRILSPGVQIPPALERAERWLMSQQMENGCFRNDGQVFHRELKGGLNEEGEIASVALTAYITTSLIESSANIPSRTIRNSLSCLRAFPLKAKSPSKVFAHALLSYAFMRIRRYEEDLSRINEASLWDRKGSEDDEGTRQLMQLLKIAKRDGDYVWWEGMTLPTSIEATSYALLALKECPPDLRGLCSAEASAATLWLNTHRSATGGFYSTQDTLVALEALSRWSFLQQPASNLTVSAKHPHFTSSIVLPPGSKVPEVIRVTPADQLEVDVQGTGCALVQATRSYNMVCSECSQEGVLTVQVGVTTDGTFNCDANNTMCYCAAVVEACVVWTGQFPEMALLEVNLPGGYGADAAKLYSQLDKSDLLLRRIELTPSGNKATLYLGGGPGAAGAGGAGGAGGAAGGGHRCYRAHGAGPQLAAQPAHVSVLNYYAPAHGHTQMYTIPEDCPPRISQETNDYLPSDNLFTKAKSLTDDSILITHEFSFEDIPEGIPLDDPMYENLTRKNKDKSRDEKSDGKTNEGVIESNIEKRTDEVEEPNISSVDKIPEGIPLTDPVYENLTKKNKDDRSGNSKKSDDNTDKSILESIVSNGVENKAITSKDFKGDSNQDNNDKIDKEFEQNYDIVSVRKTNISKVAKTIHKVSDNEIPKEIITGGDKTQNSVLKQNHYVAYTSQQKIKNNDDAVIKINNKAKEAIDMEELNINIKETNQQSNIMNDEDNLKVSHESSTNDAATNTDERQPGNIESNANIKATHQQLNIMNNESNLKILSPTNDAITYTDGEKQPSNTESNVNINGKTDNPQSTNTNHNNIMNNQVNLKGSQEKLQVNNPMLADFHVIDSEKDLDVPTGVEGPLPTVVLPPDNFVFVSPDTGVHFTPPPDASRRQFPRVPVYDPQFFQPFRDYQQYGHQQYNPVAG